MVDMPRHCLNALVAGGACAGGHDARWRHDESRVSMPLLRAVPVRGEWIRLLDPGQVTGLSQCPCCGRCLCGQLCRSARAGDARSQCPCRGRCLCGWFRRWGGCLDLSQCPCCGRGLCGTMISNSGTIDVQVCLNALVAGGACAGGRRRPVPGQPTLSQCPCCGRCLCGRDVLRSPGEGPRQAVSMPLSRAVPVRGNGKTSLFGPYLNCLNALVAGGACAGNIVALELASAT